MVVDVRRGGGRKREELELCRQNAGLDIALTVMAK
jgi:hypothetical protein